MHTRKRAVLSRSRFVGCSHTDRAFTTRPVIRRGTIWMNTFLTPDAQGTTPPTVHVRTSWAGSATPCARPCTTTVQPLRFFSSSSSISSAT
jgi:hypothetical protein